MFKNVLIIILLLIHFMNLQAQTNKEKSTVIKDMDSQKYNIKNLENFEFDDPSELYNIELSDKSDLKLYITKNAFEGKYALKMVYKLLSDNLWGSKVVARRKFDSPVMIGVFKKASIMVKGDGTLNSFKIQFVDVDEEIYTCELANVFENSSWHEVVFTRFEFIIDGASVIKDMRLSNKIKEIRFVVENSFSESVRGSILLDRFNLYASLKEFKKREKEKKISLSRSEKLFKNTFIEAEYRDINRYRAPGMLFYDSKFARGDLFWMWYSLNTEYRYRYFLVTGDIQFVGRDFSYANSRWGRYSLFGRNLMLMVDTSEFIRCTQSVSIGQINPTFNRWTFFNDKEYWWEGIELSGKLFPQYGYDKTGYNIFYVKGWDDSHAVGLKKWQTVWGAKCTFSGVLSKDNALYQKNKYTFQSKNVMTDNVGMIEVVKGFKGLTSQGGFAVVWVAYGHHYYNRKGKIYKKIKERNNDDLDNVFYTNQIEEITNENHIIGDEVDLSSLTYRLDDEGNPLFEPLNNPVKHESDLYSVRIRLKDIPFKYMEENIEYRQVGPYFKPKYLKRAKVATDVKSITYSMLINLNPQHSYKNWTLGIEGSIGESTLPKKDPYYFSNSRNIVWNIGKYIGMVGISFKQSHLWWQFPSDNDERLNSYDLYNWVILSIKFTPKIITDITLTEHSKKKYESDKTDINYYFFQYKFHFKLYLTDNALFEVDYIKTNPPDSVDFIRNEWELDNLFKASFHVDFKL